MRGTVDFYRLLRMFNNPLFGAPFRATLVFVYHRLGDLLRIGSSSFHFTTSLVLHRNSQGPQTFLFLRPSASLQTPCIAQVTTSSSGCRPAWPVESERSSWPSASRDARPTRHRCWLPGSDFPPSHAVCRTTPAHRSARPCWLRTPDSCTP